MRFEGEDDGFLRQKPPPTTDNTKDRVSNRRCCGCLTVTIVTGSALLTLSAVSLVFGPSLLKTAIRQSLAITPGSQQLEMWLRPPVQPYFYAFAFHLRNPEEVLRGAKPELEEKGPYVYKTTIVREDMKWNEEGGTLTYRERKTYTYEPEMTPPEFDANNDVVTVPNIPLWAALSIQGKTVGASGMARDMARNMVLESGGIDTPFINVTVNGLLWGYADELPCLGLDRPAECDNDDPFAERGAKEENKEKQKAGFVNCSCQWGLFRDMNETAALPITFRTGQRDKLGLKGQIVEFANSRQFGWWRRGSECDAVSGQDGGTLPPGITKDRTLSIFIPLTCRPFPLAFEREVSHAGIDALRFVPPANALDPETETNECYCPKGVKCFALGVYSVESCAGGAPLAVSLPHFYQADPKYLATVSGLHPDKEKHEFFIDVEPVLGFPLAMKAKFQINLVVGRSADRDWPVIGNMREETVLPFMWAYEGFGEPSTEMVEGISFALAAPETVSRLVALVGFVLGGIMLLAGVGFFILCRRRRILT